MPPRPNGPRLSMKESMKQLDKKTLFRLLSYMKPYRLHLVFVFICIAVSAFASVMSSLFLKSLIDDYISPLLLESNPNFSGLLYALLQMAVIYVIGAFSTLFYNRTMAVVSQGTLKKIRDEMFEHMQTLPIKFFDTHTHGDIMSFYTNDTDTLRQMISQSIPQTLSSIFTVVSVFCSMLTLSIWLTLFLIAFLFVMFKIVGKVTAKSGSYFVRQQQSLGNVNGYIEEMINGQKVIKVFCHEDKTKVEFDKRNDDLFTNASEANKFANILGPIMNALGYFLYVLIAVLGGGLALAGVPNLTLTGMGVMTLGGIASFLQLSRSFVMPISQVTQQISSIIMAMAGASRIFSLLDAESEKDEGYVTLVNAEKKNGVLTETDKHTGLWAWKHPHKDGTVTYTELTGHVELEDVDFGYTPEKTVLHDITRSSAQRAQAKRPSQTSSTASMTFLTARSVMTASTSRRSRSRISAVPSAWFCRTSTCSPAPLWRIFATVSSMPRTKSASPPQSSQTPTASFVCCRRAMTPFFPATAAASHRASASSFPSPAPPLQTLPS